MPLAAQFLTDLLAGELAPLSDAPLYLSLHTGAVATLANELDAAANEGYLRARISGHAAPFEYAVGTAGAASTLRSRADTFSPIARTADWPSVASVGLTRHPIVGAAGDALLGYGALASPVVVRTDHRLRVPAGTVTFDVAPGAFFTDEGIALLLGSTDLERPLSGSTALDVWWSLHTDDPTAANELSGDGYARLRLRSPLVLTGATSGSTRTVSFADVDDAQLQSTWGWPQTGAIADPTTLTAPTHWGIWDAESAGNLLARSPISPAAPAAPASGYYYPDLAQMLAMAWPAPT